MRIGEEELLVFYIIHTSFVELGLLLFIYGYGGRFIC